MPSDDRDPKFERALAQHLRGGSAQANCPDAETLAAYHERNLSLEEMAQWKQHISACEACQEALALVETTENQLAEDWEERGIPVLEAASIEAARTGTIAKRSAKAAVSAPQAAATPVEIHRRRRPALLRWAIPLGAVAAGVLVFIGYYEQRAPKVARYADTVIAQHQAPAESSPRLGEPEPKAYSREDRAFQQAEAELDAKRQTGEMPGQNSRRMSPPARSAKDDVLAQDEERADKKKESLDHLARARPAAPTKTPAPANIPAQSTIVSNLSAAPPIPAAPPPAPAPMTAGNIVGGAAGGQRMRDEAKSVPPPAKEKATVELQAASRDTQTNAMMMKQGVATQVVEVSGVDPGLILTPDNKVFWKLLQPAGTLQLTTDGGKKWKLLDTGANANLTAGFAPSSRVCWIAGKAGTLLLTTDRGGHWTRISTPITGDLGGVHASDAKHASIWDAAHHISYETSDGGATWKQTANE